MWEGGGGGEVLYGTMDSILALHTAAPGSIPGNPKVFSEIFPRKKKMSMLTKLIDSFAA